MKRFLAFLFVGGLFVPSLVFAQVNANDPLSSLQWYLEQIQVQEAWQTARGNGRVIVAVLDSGVDIEHEDLVGNIYQNPREIAGDNIDNDRNGYVDDVNGWDFYSDDNDPNPVIDQAVSAGVHHGTAVSGIIGAVGNNNLGITGINWDVEILPLRVLNTEGDGSMGDIVSAINYATDMGADVINMSFVGNYSARVLDDAIQRAYDNGVIVVAAAGNEDGGLNLDDTPRYPVCNVGDGTENVVIGVAATTQSDERASFSNYGSKCVDISAPGVLLMTSQVETRASDAYSDDWSGTSFAAPVISGAAALIRSVFPEATPSQVLTVLQLSVDPVRGRAPNGRLSALGSGRVNIARAFDVVPNILGAVPVQADPVEAPEREPESTEAPVVPTGAHVLAIAASKGSEPRVGVVDEGGSVVSWLAYAAAFKGGIHARVGNLSARQGREVVTAPGAGGGPHIRVFSDQGDLLSEFFAYGASFTGGVSIDTSDVDGDGLDEIVVVSGDAGLPVRVFEADGTLIHEIKLDHGLRTPYLQVQDLNADGSPELLLTGGPGADPQVTIYTFTGRSWNAFTAYRVGMDKGLTHSAHVTGRSPRIVTGTGDGAGPHVRVFSRTGAFVTQFFAFEATDRNGVAVAYQEVGGQMRIATVSETGGVVALRYFDENGQRIGSDIPLSGFQNYVTISAQ